MMRALSRLVAASCAVACGPRVADGVAGDGGASSDASTGESTSMQDVTSGTGDASTGETTAPAGPCDDSALPAPLCHRRVASGITDGFRARQVVGARASTPRFAMVPNDHPYLVRLLEASNDGVSVVAENDDIGNRLGFPIDSRLALADLGDTREILQLVEAGAATETLDADTLTPVATFGVDGSPRAHALDFDGDGRDEVLTPSAIWRRDPQGWTSAWVLPPSGEREILAGGDLDGDGRDEALWLVRQHGCPSPDPFGGDACATLEPTVYIAAAPVAGDEPSMLQRDLGFAPASGWLDEFDARLAVDDFDGDGHDDVVALATSGFYILRGVEADYLEPPLVARASLAYPIHAADLDADGRAELLASDLAVVEDVFAPTVAGGGWVGTIMLVEDLDGDGVTDIVAEESEELVVYLSLP